MSHLPKRRTMRLLPENVEVVLEHIAEHDDEYEVALEIHPSCKARGRTAEDALQAMRRMLSECSHAREGCGDDTSGIPLASQCVAPQSDCCTNDVRKLVKQFLAVFADERTYRNEAEGAIHIFGSPICVETSRERREQAQDHIKQVLHWFVKELEDLTAKYGLILAAHRCPEAKSPEELLIRSDINMNHMCAVIIPEIKGYDGEFKEVHYHALIPSDESNTKDEFLW